MKEIKAYVRPSMIDAVVDALEAMPGIPGVAVMAANGFGHVEGDGSVARVTMARLEVEVPDELVGPIIGCLRQHARTGEGHTGDGRIYVAELSRVIRIADGAEGDQAF